MSAAHRELQRVVTSLAARLDGQFDGLLAADRFAEGREALERLQDAAARARLDALPEEEAAWLAAELVQRWAAIGPVELDPVAWLEVEPPLADPDGPAGTWLRVLVDGLEAGWTVAWAGAEPDADNEQRARAGTETARVVTRVMGRGPAGRVILVATWAAESPLPSGRAAGTPLGEALHAPDPSDLSDGS
ncbi:hypothetical protein [Micromonospora sp. NPDC005806]|uniref:hypothetical protein n=1 Tax=Micromonospora sp. NPDC005806 TaxID=3364234 RepID=UPI0036A36A9D